MPGDTGGECRGDRASLLAVMAYPCAVQLAFSAAFHADLLGNPTPGHLLALFLPPVLFALGVLLSAAVRAHTRVPAEPASAA